MPPPAMMKRLRRKFKSVRKRFGRSNQVRFCPDALTSITEFDVEDVFAVGYPKSGNTWLQDLVSAVIYGVIPEYCPPLLSQDLMPDVHSRLFYRRYATPMFFKTHHLPRPEYRRVVYLVRDGRDVMVSYFHYISNRKGKPVDFLQLVREGTGLFPSRWAEHVDQWLSNPFGAEMLLVKYEDLKANPALQLERICEFAGIKRDLAFIHQMAKATEFEKMQSREARMGLGDERWPKDKLFRRRGKVGSYIDEMPPTVMRAFLMDAGATLRKLGYDDSMPDPLIAGEEGGSHLTQSTGRARSATLPPPIVT